METIFVEQDRLLVVIPEDHPLADCDKFPISELLNSPFMLLEKAQKRKSPKFSRGTVSRRKFLLQHGTTTPLCPWWKMD